jgi:simple sugar transport system substrate-binding protein
LNEDLSKGLPLRWIALARLAFALLLTWGQASSGAQTRIEPLRVAFTYISPIGQAGWTFEHEKARRHLEAVMGGQVRTSFVEAVPEGADAERVLRDLVRQGNQLIFATSFGYQEAVVRVAADAPTVRFEHAGGYKTAANLGTYNVRMYEARWLAGYLSGRVSKTGQAGYVAGFPVPEVIQGIDAFTLGMRAANPSASVRVIWLNTWFNPALEREAALSLVNAGADVLTHHSGSTAVVQLAEEKGVRVVAYQSDMHAFAPRAQLAAVTADWASYYERIAKSVIDGSWRSRADVGGMKEGMVRLAAIDATVGTELQRELARHEADLIAGRDGPFFGRLVDQSGRVRQESGAMPEADINTLNWFVEGVQGTLPIR